MTLWAVKYSEFRRGDENRPYPRILASTRMNGKMSNMVPFIAPPGNRDVAGDFHRPYEGRVPFIVPVGNRNVTGDFHRPYEGRFPFIAPLGNRNVGGRFSSPLRKCAIHPTARKNGAFTLPPGLY